MSAIKINRSRSSWPILAAVALCGALAYEPARADYYAFGNTQGHFAILALNGASCSAPRPDCFSTNGLQGWVETGSFNVAGPAGNTNYIAGLFNGSYHNNFFGFDVAGQGNVTSAALIIYSGVITSGLTYTLNSVTGTGFDTALGTVFTGQNGALFSPNASYYNEIEQGAPYATYAIGPTSPTVLDVTLDGLAVGDIDAAIRNGSGLFAIGGSVTPNPPISAPRGPTVPEPSTWVMMLGGFGALGFMAYRRRAKLRPARPPG